MRGSEGKISFLSNVLRIPVEDDERYDVCFGKRGRDWNRAAGSGAVVGLDDGEQSCVTIVIHMVVHWKGKELMHVGVCFGLLHFIFGKGLVICGPGVIKP